MGGYVRCVRALEPGHLYSYIDESGDTGFGAYKSSVTFTLGCLVVNSSRWAEVLDEYIAFRRRLKLKFGLPVRAEIKANYLLRGSGSLKELKLSPGERHLIFRGHVKFVAENPHLHVFAVVASKTGRITGVDLFRQTWVRVLQRLQRTSESLGSTTVQLIHDDGENDEIRKLARWARRQLSAGSRFGAGALSTPFTQLVEDPMPRDSQASFFIQISDLVAYAAYRRLNPGLAKTEQIVPSRTWDLFGEALLARVVAAKPGEPRAIVRLQA